MVLSDGMVHFLKIKIFFLKIYQNYLVALNNFKRAQRKVFYRIMTVVGSLFFLPLFSIASFLFKKLPCNLKCKFTFQNIK